MDAARWWPGAPDRSNRSHLASRPLSLVGRELPGSGCAQHPATRTTSPATRGGRRQHSLPLTYVELFNSGKSTGKVSLWQLSSCPCLIGKICSMEQSLHKAMPLDSWDICHEECDLFHAATTSTPPSSCSAFAIISLPFAFVCSLFPLVLFLFSGLAHFYDA